jgi:hypothetical protein
VRGMIGAEREEGVDYKERFWLRLATNNQHESR